MEVCEFGGHGASSLWEGYDAPLPPRGGDTLELYPSVEDNGGHGIAGTVLIIESTVCTGAR